MRDFSFRRYISPDAAEPGALRAAMAAWSEARVDEAEARGGEARHGGEARQEGQEAR
jgi:hypothetical protein